MNFGLDIDGTITEYPDFFAAFSKAMRAQGHKVYVISGRGVGPETNQRIEKTGIEYDGVYLTDRYNSFERTMIHDLNDGQSASNECVIGAFKQRICRELKIDIMFDDQGAIHQWFGITPVFVIPKRPGKRV